MKQKPQTKNQKGFTIIEIAITLLIIGVAVILYQSGLSSIALLRDNKYKELALHIADNEVESLRQNGYGSLPGSGTFSNSLLSSLPNSSATLTVSTVNSTTKEVDAAVSWKGTAGTTQSITVSSLITQTGGLQ